MRIRTITIECRDPYPLVAFWTKVTDYQEDPGNPNEPDDPEGLLIAPDGSLRLLFIRVAEPVGGASRIHLDLAPSERSRDEEVDRLLKMGATLVADHRETDGESWVLLADPEGNEFSVARRAVEEGPAAEQAVPLLADPVSPGAAKASEGWQARLAAWTAAKREEGGRSPLLLRLFSRDARARFVQLIRLVLLVVEALIALRVVLKVAGANQNAGFANLIYKVTSPLVGPFHPVFADHPVNGHPFEVGSLLAMAVYAAAAYLLLRLVRVLTSPAR